MEERGSSMTDGTPLVNIRKTLARMKQEVVTMDVRIGVVQHTLVQAKLKDKSLMQRDAYNWNSSGNGNQENYFQWVNVVMSFWKLHIRISYHRNDNYTDGPNIAWMIVYVTTH